MTLEEAKKVMDEATMYENPEANFDVAWETISNYIENESIPKEKVKDRIEEIRGIEWQPGTRTAGKSVKYWKLVGKEEALEELLEK